MTPPLDLRGPLEPWCQKNVKEHNFSWIWPSVWPLKGQDAFFFVKMDSFIEFRRSKTLGNEPSKLILKKLKISKKYSLKYKMEKNSGALKIRIWKNPTDKSFILLIQNFCQLGFLISAFLWTLNFFPSLSDFFHEFWYILYLVSFFNLWMWKLWKFSLILREGS